MDIDVNSTGAKHHYTKKCQNGYEYDIPTDRSTVTEVIHLNLI